MGLGGGCGVAGPVPRRVAAVAARSSKCGVAVRPRRMRSRGRQWPRLSRTPPRSVRGCHLRGVPTPPRGGGLRSRLRRASAANTPPEWVTMLVELAEWPAVAGLCPPTCGVRLESDDGSPCVFRAGVPHVGGHAGCRHTAVAVLRSAATLRVASRRAAAPAAGFSCLMNACIAGAGPSTQKKRPSKKSATVRLHAAAHFFWSPPAFSGFPALLTARELWRVRHSRSVALLVTAPLPRCVRGTARGWRARGSLRSLPGDCPCLLPFPSRVTPRVAMSSQSRRGRKVSGGPLARSGRAASPQPAAWLGWTSAGSTAASASCRSSA